MGAVYVVMAEDDEEIDDDDACIGFAAAAAAEEEDDEVSIDCGDGIVADVAEIAAEEDMPLVMLKTRSLATCGRTKV